MKTRLQQGKYYFSTASARGMRALLLLLSITAALAEPCAWGEEPGVWLRTEWATVPGRGTTLDYFRLDESKESVWLETSQEPENTPFGSAWQTLSPHCQLRNILNSYLTSSMPREHNITIAFIGDSNDEHELDFLCMAFHARHGYGRWRAYVHSHKTINYCILESGLALVQVYSMSLDVDAQYDVVNSLQQFFQGNDSDAYRLWDGYEGTKGTLEGRSDDVALLRGRWPTLVVCSNTYWALNTFSERDATARLVHTSYLTEYAKSMHSLLDNVRTAFPNTRIGLRTSHQVRSDCFDGDTTRRSWAKRMWVAQVNHAKRAVAHSERRHGRAVFLFDVELMAAGFTPAQSTGDDIHYKAWLGMELLNVYLNAAAL